MSFFPRASRAKAPPTKWHRPLPKGATQGSGILGWRYYQLLSGHAAIESFLHDRMTGPQRLDSDKCWW